MWTNANRARYGRSGLRYPSDLTDAEWALVEPLIPPAKRGGNKRSVNLWAVVNGLMDVPSTGCQWRALPKDLPPRGTVHGYLALWDYDGTLERMHHALYVRCREQAGREAGPTAGAGSAAASRSRSSSAPIRPRALPCCPSAGSLILRQAQDEGTIGWLNRCRRLAKDWECKSQNARAFLLLAAIRLMTRKLCQKTI